MRLLTFLEEPTTGSILYRSRNGGSGPQARSRRGPRFAATLVEQNPYLFHGKVFDNLVLGLRAWAFRKTSGRLGWKGLSTPWTWKVCSSGAPRA